MSAANTYGEHQDEAASALARLLAAELPSGEVEIATVEACQAMIRTALLDRLRLLGVEHRKDAQQRPPLMRLAQLVDQFPDRDGYADDALSPLDALQPYALGVLGATARTWQTAASATMLATEALAGDQRLKPLLSQGQTLWRLTTDAANTIEALAVLNQDLVSAGALPGRPDLDHLDALRQETSYIARMGEWYGLDASADLATRGAGTTQAAWQVHLVRSAADLEPAQRRLGDFLAPKARSGQQPRLTRSEALALTTTQLRVATLLAETSSAALGERDVTTRRLVQLREHLDGLRGHLPRLRDTAPATPRLNVMGQLTELSTGITRVHGRRELGALSPAQLDTLAQTCRWACGRYAKTLIYETTRTGGKLRFQAVIPDENPCTRPTHPERESLERLTHGAPIVPGPTSLLPDPTSARAQLRHALDHTPTTPPPLLPSPSTGRGFGR